MVRKANARAGPSVTWSQVHAFRMARHHLDRPLPKTQVTRAAADACGVQAQVMVAAQLALRVRVRGLTIEDVDRALWHNRSLARVWCMRGTVHLVPSEDFAIFVRGSSTRQVGLASRWFERAGVAKAFVERLIEAASAAMDRPRTRGEIASRISDSLGLPIERGGSRGWGSPAEATGFKLGAKIVMVPDIAFVAAYRGLACFGPDEGEGTTFVRPDAWLPRWRDVPLEDAEDALLRRYLRSFAPATASDFFAWSRLTMGRARHIWSRLEDELSPVTVEGRGAWILRGDQSTLERAKAARPTVRLLPYFDSYLMGHNERGHLVDKAHYAQIYRPAGWVYPAVLLDGHVVGHWSYERHGKSLQVRVQPHESLPEATKDLVRGEAEDVARFLGISEAHVTFAKVR